MVTILPAKVPKLPSVVSVVLPKSATVPSSKAVETVVIKFCELIVPLLKAF